MKPTTVTTTTATSSPTADPANPSNPSDLPPREQEDASGTPWKMIIVGLAVLALIAAAIFFWPKGTKKDASTNDNLLTQIEQMIDEKMAERDLPPPLDLESSVEAEATTTSTVAESNPAPQMEKVRDIKNYQTRFGGTVIKKIGPPVMKNGKKYLPLFSHPTEYREALTEPVGTSVEDVERNATWVKVNPGPGKMAVFDVVRNPNTNELYNIIAWEVAN